MLLVYVVDLAFHLQALLPVIVQRDVDWRVADCTLPFAVVD